MESGALMVPKDKLEKYLANLVSTEKEIVKDLQTIIPYVINTTMKSSMEKRLSKGLETLKALEAGYVPVVGSFSRTDTKARWQKKWVKESLDSMPSEVKEVWEKVKEKGIFDSFSVTTGGGDPLLVGNKGGKHFFIAGWLPIAPGLSLGIRIKLP